MRMFFAKLGALRGMLVIILVLLIIMGPFAGGDVKITGFALFTSVVAPAFYVIMLFVIPLDMIMTRVFMGEAEGEQRARYRFIIRVELALMALMLLAWMPFIIKLIKTAY